MAKTKIETGVAILTKEQAVKLYPSIYRDEIARFTEKFRGLVITNQEELTTVRVALTALNKIVNKVEAERKRLGKPYKDAKAEVDLVGKDIIGEAPEMIEEVKIKISDFENAEEKKRNEAAQQQEAEQRAKLKEIDAAKNKKLSIIADIRETAAAAADRLQKATDFEDFKSAFQLHVVDQFNKIIATYANDPEICEFATEAKATLVALKNTLKDARTKGTKSNAGEVVANLQDLSSKAIESVVEEAQGEKADTMIATQAAIANASTGSMNSDRFRWSFEVVDFSQVDDSWKTVDTDAVTEYINLHKEELEDGKVVNGIKFNRVRSVVLS